MGFRFRKRIGPNGLKFNIGKNGISSTSVKLTKGITYNSKQGLTLGIPGTGMSYNFGKNKPHKPLASANNTSEHKGIAKPLPLSRTQGTFGLPTERQLSYARDLGITIPENISKEDISYLIERTLSKESEPNPELVEFALSKGILLSSYIGNKGLYNLIFESLNTEDKIAFFTFSIYRWVSDDRHANLDTHSNKDVFYEFVKTVISNDAFMKSMNRYKGENLRFFGTYTREDNGAIWECPGSSNGTISYKMVANFLKDKFNTPLTRSKAFSNDNPNDYINDLDTDDSVKRLNLLDNKNAKSSKRFNANKEYNKGWKEFTGGYNKKALVVVVVCTVLCLTPVWPLGLILAIPCLLWFIIDTSYKVLKYNKHMKNMDKNSVNLRKTNVREFKKGGQTI